MGRDFEPVTEALSRMHAAFVALGDSLHVSSESALASEAVRVSRALSRMAGEEAAHEDWDDILWPGGKPDE